MTIDRAVIAARHSPRIGRIDPDAVLSLSNGDFAFNVDRTGLQGVPAAYTRIPLATLSHWAWHSQPKPESLANAELRLKQYSFHGRNVGYMTDSAGQTEQFNYLRENPHRPKALGDRPDGWWLGWRADDAGAWIPQGLQVECAGRRIPAVDVASA